MLSISVNSRILHICLNPRLWIHPSSSVSHPSSRPAAHSVGAPVTIHPPSPSCHTHPHFNGWKPLSALSWFAEKDSSLARLLLFFNSSSVFQQWGPGHDIPLLKSLSGNIQHLSQGHTQALQAPAFFCPSVLISYLVLLHSSSSSQSSLFAQGAPNSGLVPLFFSSRLWKVLPLCFTPSLHSGLPSGVTHPWGFPRHTDTKYPSRGFSPQSKGFSHSSLLLSALLITACYCVFIGRLTYFLFPTLACSSPVQRFCLTHCYIPAPWWFQESKFSLFKFISSSRNTWGRKSHKCTHVCNFWFILWTMKSKKPSFVCSH